MMTTTKTLLTSLTNQMPILPIRYNKKQPPKYKKGDLVTQIRAGSTSKGYKARKGILRSDGDDTRRSSADRGGKRHYVYDVQWDGKTGTNEVRQNRLKPLEESK